MSYQKLSLAQHQNPNNGMIEQSEHHLDTESDGWNRCFPSRSMAYNIMIAKTPQPTISTHNFHMHTKNCIPSSGGNPNLFWGRKMKGPGLRKGGISSVLRQGLQKRPSWQSPKFYMQICTFWCFLASFVYRNFGGKKILLPKIFKSWVITPHLQYRCLWLGQSHLTITRTLPNICRICLV